MDNWIELYSLPDILGKRADEIPDDINEPLYISTRELKRGFHKISFNLYSDSPAKSKQKDEGSSVSVYMTGEEKRTADYAITCGVQPYNRLPESISDVLPELPPGGDQIPVYVRFACVVSEENLTHFKQCRERLGQYSEEIPENYFLKGEVIFLLNTNNSDKKFWEESLKDLNKNNDFRIFLVPYSSKKCRHRLLKDISKRFKYLRSTGVLGRIARQQNIRLPRNNPFDYFEGISILEPEEMLQIYAEGIMVRRFFNEHFLATETLDDKVEREAESIIEEAGLRPGRSSTDDPFERCWENHLKSEIEKGFRESLLEKFSVNSLRNLPDTKISKGVDFLKDFLDKESHDISEVKESLFNDLGCLLYGKLERIIEEYIKKADIKALEKILKKTNEKFENLNLEGNIESEEEKEQRKDDLKNRLNRFKLPWFLEYLRVLFCFIFRKRGALAKCKKDILDYFKRELKQKYIKLLIEEIKEKPQWLNYFKHFHIQIKRMISRIESYDDKLEKRLSDAEDFHSDGTVIKAISLEGDWRKRIESKAGNLDISRTVQEILNERLSNTQSLLMLVNQPLLGEFKDRLQKQVNDLVAEEKKNFNYKDKQDIVAEVSEHLSANQNLYTFKIPQPAKHTDIYIIHSSNFSNQLLDDMKQKFKNEGWEVANVQEKNMEGAYVIKEICDLPFEFFSGGSNA